MTDTVDFHLADPQTAPTPAPAGAPGHVRSELHPGQHRLARVQLVNWGTFSGYHAVPVSRRGFLLTGPSGSGKSSLLDAISVVLVPPKWLDLNAAARDVSARGRDRTLLSYVRGAWSRNTDETSGELATQQLRPGATWSAVGLTFDDGAGTLTTLVRVFWAGRGVTSVDAVAKVCLILDGDVDLRTLEPEVQGGVNLRTLKQALDPVFASVDFAPYADKLARRLGVQGERALRLLHKTQSTKGLSDLDALLRDFMLDEPATFGAAQRTVEQFVELEEAYRSVQRAQAQVTHLRPTRTLHATLRDATERVVTLEAERDALDAYRATRAVEVLRSEVGAAEQVLAAAQDAAEDARRDADDAEHELDALRTEHGRAGGTQLEQWRTEIAAVDEERAARQRRRTALEVQLDVLDEPFPADQVAFRALVARATATVQGGRGADGDLDAERDDARDRLRHVQAELAEATAQVRALTEQRSNLDRRDLEMRDALAAAIGVSPARLPFVAELLQVRDEHVEWRGAVERLLGGFARSVIVPDALYDVASEHISSTHLGRRLLYNRVPARAADEPRLVGSSSVAHLLEVADVDVAPWLRAELARRFDHVCAANLAEFRAAERAVLVDGQVKHGRVRHEKDDRHRIDDARTWVLGFDNHGKRALFEDEVTRLTAERDAQIAAITAVKERIDARQHRARAWQVVQGVHWDDVDTDGSGRRVHDLQRRIAGLTDVRHDLGAIDERLVALRARSDRARERQAHERATVLAAEEQLRQLHVRLDRRVEDLAVSPALADAVRTRLDERFDAYDPDLTSTGLDEVAARVSTGVGREVSEAERVRAESARELERLFLEFQTHWPTEAADVPPVAEHVLEFLAILERLEFDGLPRFSDRFSELLDEQSTNNLAHLAQLMSLEQKQIRARITPVNDSLASVEFNRGTHLQIVVKDRALAEVRDFRARVRTILENSFTATHEDKLARFGDLHALVTRLGSSEPVDQAWRNLVLDVRRHVEFLGEERAADGTVVEVHTSGAGRSGGQRVKLVTFALAAALRYQLGGRYAGMPVYGTVVIDEAFDKADAEFTEVSMRIFEEFGFQMVLATPLKMVQTLSEFIGGAALVGIRDRKYSSLRHVEVDSLST